MYTSLAYALHHYSVSHIPLQCVLFQYAQHVQYNRLIYTQSQDYAVNDWSDNIRVHMYMHTRTCTYMIVHTRSWVSYILPNDVIVKVFNLIITVIWSQSCVLGTWVERRLFLLGWNEGTHWTLTWTGATLSILVHWWGARIRSGCGLSVFLSKSLHLKPDKKE